MTQLFYHTLRRLRWFATLLTLLCCFWLPVAGICVEPAQESSDAGASPGSQEPQTAPVIIDGNVLFKLIGVSTFPAEKRVEAVSKEIIKLAENPSFDPATLEVKTVDGIVVIFAGDKQILYVYDEDAKIEGDFEPETIANNLFVKQMSAAITNYRKERDKGVLLKKIRNALLWTLGLAVLLTILFWGFRKFDQLLENRFKRKIEKLETKSKRIFQSDQIWPIVQVALRLARIIIVLTILYVFINNVLALFPWTRYISQTLLGYIINPLLSMWQAVVDYLPSLFFLIVLIFVFSFLLKLTRAFFNGIDRGRIKINNFHADWAWPTYRIVRVVLIMLGVVIAYPYIPGSGSEAFKGISLLFGVLLSLGSTSLISNVIAGYTMTYRRAFKVGDRVKIGNNIGDVSEIHLLVTILRSLKNEEISLPNSSIINGEVINYTSKTNKLGLILHTTVGIGYEVPWRQVKAMLLMAAERTSGLQRKSEPFVLQTALGDFGVNYELNVFCKKAEEMVQIYSDLHSNIQDVFNEYEVAIMTPHYTGDTMDPKLVPKEQWYISPATSPPE